MIRRRRRFVRVVTATIFLAAISLFVLGSGSYAEEGKVIKIRVKRDPMHGGDKPCHMCMKSVSEKCQKMKSISSVKIEGDIVEIKISGDVKAEDITKTIDNMGFKTEIIEDKK